MNNRTRIGLTRMLKRLTALWPRWPLAMALVLVGGLNVLDGSSVPPGDLEHVQALTGLAGSLSILGGTAQIILGVMLVLAGLGLLWRLLSAWTVAILLLVITVGVNIAQEKWGPGLLLQTILLGVLWWTRPYFSQRTILANFFFSLSSIVAILAYGTIGSYLLGDDYRPPIHDWTTSLYYTVVTLSTVGYGDFVPVTTEARWFVISLLVLGLGVFAGVFASALGPKISGELQRVFNPKVKTMEYKDHVILVGEGAIARNTATELKRRGVLFVQIVTSEAELMADMGHQLIEGDATEDSVLRQAGIQYANMVIAAREDDGENAFIALVVKDLNPDIRLLAVASTALSIRRMKLAGADLVFSPAAVGSRLLADLVQGNQIPQAFQDLLKGGLHEK